MIVVALVAASHVKWRLPWILKVCHVNVIWEPDQPCVSPEEPHTHSEKLACILEFGVNECLSKVGPDIAEVHQVADDDTTLNIVHNVSSIEETESQKMMQAHLNVVVSLFLGWDSQMSDRA